MMPPTIFSQFIAAALTWLALCGAVFAGDAELRGVVTDSASGVPLEGVLVTLTPVGGSAALEATTGVLGRYPIDAVPPGGYTLGATHPGYLPHSEAKTYAADEIATADIALVKAPGAGVRIKLELTVHDTKTNRALEGVPVRIQYFPTSSAVTPISSVVKVSDDKGRVTLHSQPTGWYEFRYNFAADGTDLKWYNTYTPLRRDELLVDHGVIAKLLPKPQTVKVTVTGLDPNKIDDGEVVLEGVTVELLGVMPGFMPPPGFDPDTDDLRKKAPNIVQLLAGKTDDSGAFSFANLPPNDYICTVKKPGYTRTQGIITAAADGTLPAMHSQLLLLDFSTVVSVVVENGQYDNTLLDGLPVTLRGFEGTLTGGFEREMPAFAMPGPMGDVYVVDFDGLLPGRYSAIVDHVKVSPPTIAAEDAVTVIGIDWRGEKNINVAQGMPNTAVLMLDVVPATIRGRFFKAESRSEQPVPNLGGLPAPLEQWLGPAYDMVPETHIEFLQSDYAPYLLPGPPPMPMDPPVPPGFKVATDAFGNFEITVPPSFYGVICPLLDGYWGSNFRSKNLTTGEVFALGWPYPGDGPIPGHPFGSRGIPISSGDVIEMDLYVRKQSYFLDGIVLGDLDCPLLDLIVAGDHSSNTFLGVEFSHVSRTGDVKFDLGADGGPEEVVDLLPGKSVVGGACIENPNATFLVKDVPPGGHKVTVDTPQYAQIGGVFELPVLPDFGFPGSGEGGSGGGVIPMQNNWGQIGGLLDPWISDYKGDHDLNMEFAGKGPGDTEEVRFTKSNPTLVRHTSVHGDRMFRVGVTPMFEMYHGTWEFWILEAGDWYHDSITIGAAAPPTTFTVRFLLKSEWGAAADAKISPPPSPAYDLVLRAVVDGDPTVAVAGLEASFTGPPPAGAGTTLTSAATGAMPTKKPAWTGGFTPTFAAGQTLLTKWDLVDYDREVDIGIGGAGIPTVTITARLKRASAVFGVVNAKLDYEFDPGGGPETRTSTKPFGGAIVRLFDRNGNGPIRELTTMTDGSFTTAGMPLTATGTIYVDITQPGYKPYRMRFNANAGDDMGAAIDFDLTMPPIDLEMIPQPTLFADEVVFDRAGPFLVGVEKNDAVITGGTEPLEMTYDLKADSAPKWMQKRVSFDTKEGAAGAVTDIEVLDPVTRIWVIDAKHFPDAISETTASEFTLPGEILPKELTDPMNPNGGFKDPAPDPLFNHKMAGKLRTVGGPMFKNQLYRISKTLAQADVMVGGDDLKRATGSGVLFLPDMPPGPFTPFIVAETARGSFRYFKAGALDGTFSELDDPEPVLYGMQSNPPWLSRVVDLIATLEAVDAELSTLEQMADIVPDSTLRLTAGAGGTVTKNPLEDPMRAEHTLRYDYGLNVDFKYGMPASITNGWLSIVASPVVKARGTARILVNGKKDDNAGFSEAPAVRAPTISITGTGAVDTYAALPNFDDIADEAAGAYKNAAEILDTFPPVVLKAKGRGRAELSSTDKLVVPRRAGDVLGPLERHMFSRFDGFSQLEIGADVLAFFGGDLLTASVYLGTKNTVGGDVLLDLTTRYREAIPANFDSGPNPRRTHAFGEEAVNYQTVNDSHRRLYLGHEGLVKGTLGFGVIGAETKTGVKGNGPPPGSRVSKVLDDALIVELNTSGKGPAVRRIHGELFHTRAVFANVILYRPTLKYIDIAIPINYNPNTVPSFDLYPNGGSYSVLSPASAPETAWCGEHPQLVADFFPLSRYALSSGGGGALAYASVTASGSMELKASLRSGDTTWGAPSTITSAAGVAGVSIEALAAGGWIAVWSEVAAGDIGKDPTPTTIKSATSADGLTWSAPATVASTPGSAFDLKLMPMPTGDLGLVWLEAERGLGTTLLDLEGAFWESSTATWGAPVVLFDDVTLFGWDAAGPGYTGTEPAQIVAFTDGGAGLVAVGWDGTTLGAPVGIDGSTEGPYCAVTSGPADTFTAVYQLEEGGALVAQKVGAGAWTMLPPMPAFDGLGIDGLDIAPVDDGVGIHYMVGYSEPGGASALGFAYLDGAGALLTGPTQVQRDFGDYRSVQVLPTSGVHGGQLLGVFENTEAVSELRSFATTEAGGLIAIDLDTDTLDDNAELRIVDADPADPLEKITDVLPVDDFDLDGYSNGVELAAGTDPTDPGSHPGQIVGVETFGIATEFGASPCSFVITRTGDLSGAIDVLYTLGGTATVGDDYLEPVDVGTASFATGEATVVIGVTALSDTLAEGDETAILTITPDAAYTLGAMASGSVTIQDLPLDGWRFTEFTTSDLADEDISGLAADTEGDGLNTLLEYAFDSAPKVSSLEDAPITGIVEHETTGAQHMAVAYLRIKDASDIVYRIQLSGTLDTDSWSDAGSGEIEEISVIDNGDGTETVTVRSTSPLSASARRFMRVLVVQIAG